MISVPLSDIARLAKVVPAAPTVSPGELIAVNLALPIPENTPALGDYPFTIDVKWIVANAAPPIDADGFVIPPISVTPKPTGAGPGPVVLAPAEALKLGTLALPFFLAWWNSTDYSDPDYDPNAEIVQVTAVTVITDTLTVTRAQLNTVAAAHNDAGKSYRMRPVPPLMSAADVATVAYDNAVTAVDIKAGHENRLPTAFPFFAVWWNATDYTTPAADPVAETIKVTAIAVPAVGAPTLTVVRGQQGTQAVAHNTGAKTYKLKVAPALPKKDFIAPATTDKLSALFGLMPNIGPAAVNRPYWLIAEFTLRAPFAVAPLLQEVYAAKVSPPILATPLSASDVLSRLTELFKIELPTLPVSPGSIVTAKLRPRGAEDSEWDVQSASEVVPRYDLAAKVQLDPLFKPLGKIVNGVFGVANRILGTGVRLLVPLVRVFGVIGSALQKLATLGGFTGKRNPLSGLNVVREIDRLLRRLRIRDVDVFKDLEMPIDASLLNRNFTTNLVPRDSVPPLPGPRGLLPTLPTLEQQLELSDQLPDATSVLPLVGTLQIPFSITGVDWELWRPSVTVSARLVAGVTSVTLAPGDANKLPSAAPFSLIWWDDTSYPDQPSNDPNREVVRVTAKGDPTLDSLTINASANAHDLAGKTYKMRLWPLAQLVPGPANPSALSSPLPEIGAPPLNAAALKIPLPAADLARLPASTPFWMVWFDAALAPDTDQNVEVVKVTNLANPITIERGRFGTTRVNHDTPASTYRLRLLGDYFELAQTAGRLFKRSFAIEPPVQPDSLVDLKVQIRSVVDPLGTALNQPVKLPNVPIRLVGIDPLALVAEQFELTTGVEYLEPGDELPVQLVSSLPLQTTDPRNIQVDLPLGVLPTRQLPISITWEVLDQANNLLADGTAYSLTGTSATARSIILVPTLSIMRREEPAVSVVYIRIRLSMASPPLQQVIGPLAVPVLPLQLPLFIAAFEKNFFLETGDDRVVVFLPEFYVSQAPTWVDSWEAFQSKINDIQLRIGRLAALATNSALPGNPALPPAAAANANFSDLVARQLSLIRGALDYVANRATGKLEFLRAWSFGGVRYAAYPWHVGISHDFLKKAQTLIIANDSDTEIVLWSSHWDSVVVNGTPNTPLAVLYRNYESDPGDPWRFWWIPSQMLGWPVGEDVNVTWTDADNWQIYMVSAKFDQYLRTNKYFPSPAELFTDPLT